MSLVRNRPGAGGQAAGAYRGPSMLALPHLLKQLWTDRLGMLSDAAAEFGDVVRFSMGPKTIYYFNHPDHAKHVLADNAANYHKGMGNHEARRVLGDGLLTSEGEIWRRQRRVTSPAFRRERIAGFASLVADAADDLKERLASHAGGGPVNISEEMTQLTLKVLGGTLLDADLTPLQMIAPAFEVVQDQALFEMVSLGAVPLWLPLPRNQRFRAARRQLEDAVRTLVSDRERAGGDGDLISMWLAAGFGSAGHGRHGVPRLHDELVTILLAGHETTASTLSWAWYLLSQHPEAADAVRAEAEAAFGDHEPGYEDLHRLPFTTAVIQETMRLYPPVWGLTRVSQAADEIDGYRVPAGADVMICTYTLHRHPGFWPDPDEFRPERFAVSGSATTHKYAYIPFGAGPRVCVGSHLGMLEATLVTAIVARELGFSLPGGYRPVAEAMMSLRVRGGLRMNVHKV